jgi:hypothetical protein
MEKIIWNNIPAEQVNPKMKRQFIHGEKIMIAKMEFEDGFTVPHTGADMQPCLVRCVSVP